MFYSLVELPENNFDAFLEGLIPSLVCIIIVFLVLGLLTVIINVVNKLEFLDDKKEEKVLSKSVLTSTDIDINDDDMMAAILACAIDYRESVKTDIKVVSVKRID